MGTEALWMPAMMMGGGSLLGGMGSMFSAFGDPGTPAQINPEIQAALQSMGIDLNQFQAEQGAAQNLFGQGGVAYGQDVAAARQNALNEVLGGPQGQAQQFIQSAFAGQPTAADINQQSLFGTQLGLQGRNAMNSLQSQLAQANIDPRSGAYADALARATSGIESGQASALGNMSVQQQQANLGRAANLYSMLQNGPLAGTQMPERPLTDRERWDKEQQDALAALNQQYSGGFGRAGARGEEYNRRKNEIMNRKPPWEVQYATNRIAPSWETNPSNKKVGSGIGKAIAGFAKSNMAEKEKNKSAFGEGVSGLYGNRWV